MQQTVNIQAIRPEGRTDGPSAYKHRDHLPPCLSKIFDYKPGLLRDVKQRIVVSGEIAELFGKTTFLCAKQVPSCLTMRRTGSLSLQRREILDAGLAVGIPLVGRKDGRWQKVIYSPTDTVVMRDDGTQTTLTRESGWGETRSAKSYDVEHEAFSDYVKHKSEQGSEDSFEIDPNLSQSILDEFSELKVDYTDFFLVIRAKKIAEIIGENPPKILEWNTDVIRLQDPIPLRILQRGGYTGKRKIQFTRIKDPVLREYIIFNHTFWGNKLESLASAKEDSEERSFARLLKKRIISFINNGRDPTIKSRHYDELFEEESTNDVQHRLERLIECLKTVDGIFLQRFLADPTEKWTWHTYDMFTLGNLSILITDEFLDGTLTEAGLGVKSNYAKLKQVRKMMKLNGHTDLFNFEPAEVSPWLHQFSVPLAHLHRSEGDARVQLIALLSQTRGAGTPPPLVILQSKVKFLDIVTAEPEPLTRTNLKLLDLSLVSLLEGIPDEAMTGLATAARIRVTTSACYEYGVSDAGTAQAVNDMVYNAELGRKVRIIDLHTGETVGFKSIHETTVGEYIFWRCLEEVLATHPEQLKRLMLVMISEPGKGRTVTKGVACVKIVLDVVNKLIAKPFAKAFPSSASGMEKSNHGWNVFKSFFHGELGNMVFTESEVQTQESLINKTWEDVFCSSTDLNTATDLQRHDVSQIMAGRLMSKFGVPPMLQGIVNKICFSPRMIEFTATGVLKRYGKQLSETTNVVQIRRGIMMGDPLTKPLLHMIALCARRTAEIIRNKRFQHADNAGVLHDALSTIYAKSVTFSPTG